MGMGRTRRTKVGAVFGFGVVAVAALGARAFLACGGESGAALVPDGSSEGSAVGPADAASQDGGDLDASTRPVFCEGLVLYASFDTAAAPEVGEVDVQANGSAAIVGAGKFAGSLEVIREAGAPAANLFWTRKDGGATFFPDDTGTLAFWYRGEGFEDGVVAPFYRPARDPSLSPPGTVPYLQTTLDGIAALHLPPTGGVQLLLFLQKDAVRPFLNGEGFNQIATTWRTGAGVGPTFEFLVNGGLGTPFDASAPSYADASRNDAGDLLIPYAASTTRAWARDASTGALRLGGTASLEGRMDDLGVWNRVLSRAELAALYQANAPIGEICGLR